MPAGKKLISFATIIKTVYNPNPEQSMKISIRTAMALKTKALAGGLSLLFLLGGCHKKVNYFNGEIITVKDISGKRHADRGTAAAGQYHCKWKRYIVIRYHFNSVYRVPEAIGLYELYKC